MSRTPEGHDEGVDTETGMDFVRRHQRGVLVTLKSDGRAQLSNIIYAVVDGVIRISVTATRAKTKNIRRDPRVSLYVTADDFWSYVVVEGDAELSEVATRTDDDVVEELVTMFRTTTGEHKNWAEFRRAMVDDQRLVLRLRPTYAYGVAAN